MLGARFANSAQHSALRCDILSRVWLFDPNPRMKNAIKHLVNKFPLCTHRNSYLITSQMNLQRFANNAQHSAICFNVSSICLFDRNTTM